MSTSTDKIQIAIIIPGGIGTGKGNIGVPVMERLVKLLAKDFEITVFSLFKINENYTPDGFTLIDCSAPILLLRVIKFFSAFKQINRKTKFHLVHGFWALPSGLLAAGTGKIFKMKSVISVLGGDAISLPEINYGQLRHWLSRKLVLWCLRDTDEVICLTRYLLNNLESAGLMRRDVKIIPWGIDNSLFPFHDKPVLHPIKFLHIANLSPVKDQITLLKAFKIVADQVPSVLTIIGEGVSELQIKALANDLNLTDKITFKGLIPYEVLPSHYQQADVLLHTSLSEGQSEVVTEAMSSGVVVCGTKVGLLYDQPTCCVSVPVKDYETLGGEILKMLSETKRMNAIRQNAYAWSSSHSIHWTVDELSKIYKT